jgi:putative drug exporter of the RND superfamily
MGGALGAFSARHPVWILLAWVVLGATLAWTAPDWDRRSLDDDSRFLPADSPSLRGQALLENAFPGEAGASRCVIAIVPKSGTLTSADLSAVQGVARSIKTLAADEPGLRIRQVTAHTDGPVGKRLIADDGRCVLISILLDSHHLSLQNATTVDRISDIAKTRLNDAGLTVTVTGPAGFGRDLVAAGSKALSGTTTATIVLILLVLLLVYHSPLLALIPLMTTGMAVWVSMSLLAFATLLPGIRLANVSQVFLIVILFGAGTDYCLFLISRHREEMGYGFSPAESAARATRFVGGALTASAATVVVGLGMMGFAEFGKIRSGGPVIAVGLVVGLLASLTLTPALLALGGRTLLWPQRLSLNTERKLQATRSWRMARFVVARPAFVFAVAVGILFPLAALGLKATPSFRPTGDLSPDSESLRGTVHLQRHFSAGEIGPITLILVAKHDWNSLDGVRAIGELSRGFRELEQVAEVRTLTQPLGKAPPTGLLERLAAAKHYTSTLEDGTFATRIDIVPKGDPFDPAAIETLTLLESWLAEMVPLQADRVGFVRGEVAGVTAGARDLSQIIGRDRIRVNLLVTCGVFVILLLVVRSVWLAIFLLLSVLLSYLSTLGLTAVFAHWLTGRPMWVIEWRVPFFLFTILVAVGADSNILLITRVLQEKRNSGWRLGLVRGLAATGGSITACGVIMAGTFGTLMLTDLSTLRQIGFALAVGVLLDAVLVRGFLVPAVLALMWADDEREERLVPPAAMLGSIVLKGRTRGTIR